MACKKCKSKKKSELLYIMNPKCGWCKKADPVVDALREDGYEIRALDVNKPEDLKRANEVKAMYDAQCGTPFFIDSKTGNKVCGYREKEVLEKWAKGEEVPQPAPPKSKDFKNAPKDFRNAPKNAPNDGMQLPENQLIKFEYIWIDGGSPAKLRSKIRFEQLKQVTNITNQNELLKHIPEWSFDGSSTGQADADNSDLILKPISVVPNTMERVRMPSFAVLCEVFDTEGKPHKTNKRAVLRQNMKKENSDMQFGIEQEYIIVDPISGQPHGWNKYDDTPPPQGDYYCGIGSDVNVMRDLSESHAMACNSAGIKVHGINAEVMLSQWEYQLKETGAIEAADNLWFSRFFLQRIAERLNVAISYDPKLIEDDDWNGSGAHINFSTSFMRERADMPYMTLLCSFMEKYHKDAISHYGVGNFKRLTGKNETSKYDEYTWGETDRSVSLRIPSTTVKNGTGYIEDRRPAANMDPYEAICHLATTLSEINEEMLIAT